MIQINDAATNLSSGVADLNTDAGVAREKVAPVTSAEVLESAELRALEVQHPSLKERIGNFVEGLRLSNPKMGAKGAALLVVGSSMAMIPAYGQVVILDNGLAENAQGRKGFGSYDGGTSGTQARSGDEFVLTSTMDLTDIWVAGFANKVGGAAGNVAQMAGWDVTLHRWTGTEYEFYNAPSATASFTTPSNSNYTDILGSAFGGYSLHNLEFNLNGQAGFQDLTPGRYLISVFAHTTEAGGLFRHSSSILGDQLSNYVKRPSYEEWRSTLGEAGIDFTPGTITLEGSPAVPEPASIVALGVGLATLLSRRRRTTE